MSKYVYKFILVKWIQQCYGVLFIFFNANMRLSITSAQGHVKICVFLQHSTTRENFTITSVNKSQLC